MTEFLKGYAAGANDMEAGRLVTKDAACSDPMCSYRAEVAFKRPALTAEEAQAARDWILGHRPGPYPEDLKVGRLLDQATAKLSLIANGENG